MARRHLPFHKHWSLHNSHKIYLIKDRKEKKGKVSEKLHAGGRLCLWKRGVACNITSAYMGLESMVEIHDSKLIRSF